MTQIPAVDAAAEDQLSSEAQTDNADGHNDEQPTASAENPAEDAADPLKQDVSEDQMANPGMGFPVIMSAA